MLVDLRDFTLISDALAPTNVIKMLNRYFNSVMFPIHQHGGEVMEIMGDGILAIFNDRVEGGPTTASGTHLRRQWRVSERSHNLMG